MQINSKVWKEYLLSVLVDFHRLKDHRSTSDVPQRAVEGTVYRWLNWWKVNRRRELAAKHTRGDYLFSKVRHKWAGPMTPGECVNGPQQN